MARPGGDGRASSRSWRQADGLGLAVGQPAVARTTPRCGAAGLVRRYRVRSGGARRLAGQGRRATVQVAFYDATNPGPGTTSGRRSGTTTSSYGIGLVAGRLRAGARSPATRRTCATTPDPASRSATCTRCENARTLLRRAAGRGRAGGRHPEPVGLGGQSALRRGPVVRRHRHRLRRRCAADRGRAQHRAVAASRGGTPTSAASTAATRTPGVPGGDGPLVPVRRVLPAVPPARLPRAGQPTRPRHDRRPERGVVVRRGGLRDPRGLHALRERLKPVRPAGDAGGARDRPAADAAAPARVPRRPGRLDGRRRVPVRPGPAGRAGADGRRPAVAGVPAGRGESGRDAWTDEVYPGGATRHRAPPRWSGSRCSCATAPTCRSATRTTGNSAPRPPSRRARA